MMRFIGLFTLMLSFSLQAQSLRECVSLGESYGNGKGRTDIPEYCHTKMLEASYLNAYREYDEKNVIVFGHKNYIYTYLGPKSGLKKLQDPPKDKRLSISGEQSRLEDVLSLDVNFKNNTTVALAIERKTNRLALFTYTLWLGGNVAPIKRIYSDELEGATNIRVGPKAEKIYVLFAKEKLVKVFNINDNTTGPSAHLFGKVQKNLGGDKTLLTQVQDVAFSEDGNTAYFLDASAKKVYGYDNTKLGNIAPSSIRSLPAGSSSYQAILFDSQSKTLKVVDKTGSSISVAP